jgi:hypothetical protein
VCAFHWATGKLPYSSDAKKDNEEAVKKLTLEAKYKRENYHLTKSTPQGKTADLYKKEKECFTPNLLELCEGLHPTHCLPHPKLHPHVAPRAAHAAFTAFHRTDDDRSC